MKSFSVFFLPNNKPFGRAVCDTEETMKTSAITIQRATKFIALLRPLHFNTKIQTCVLDIFLLGKICCRAGSKEAFLKVGTLSVKAWAYPRQIKTNKMNFENAAYRRYSVTMEILSFTFLFARKFLSMRTHFAAVSEFSMKPLALLRAW